ncbi:MAG: type II toxin-antitoxin system VapC family toxin [Mycobacterium sp.]|jgi:ribonuclease VapC|nr:type II toxin-antitoxin system VapC family toxin [Mycobacterium sp.]
MIVDTSAVIAVLQDKPESPRILDALGAADHASISAATLLELNIVADTRRDPVRTAAFDALIGAMALTVVPVTAEHATIARHGYSRYGRGSGHPARLNFGDCFSYALAIADDEPLLFIGDDFGQTDVRTALS